MNYAGGFLNKYPMWVTCHTHDGTNARLSFICTDMTEIAHVMKYLRGRFYKNIRLCKNKPVRRDDSYFHHSRNTWPLAYPKREVPT